MRNKLGLPPDYEPCVYIIDDDESIRTSVECLVECMGITSNSFESAELLLEETDSSICGCVFTDLRLVGISGLELIKQLKTSGYHVPAILVSGYLDVSLTVSAISDGAFSVLSKPYSEQELWDNLISAIKHDSDNYVARKWLDATNAKMATLSEEEKSVMDLLLEGHANKKIAHSLDVSERTISIRRKTILEKLGVDNIVELARERMKLQLLESQLNSNMLIGPTTELDSERN
jgi:two-component system response regulator FixJ